MPAPSSLMRSFSSASSMKRSGRSRPRRRVMPAGERLDGPAATAAEIDQGLEVRLDLTHAMAWRRSSTSACRATSASYMPGEKIALRDRPADLAAYIARSALRSSSAEARRRRSRARPRCSAHPYARVPRPAAGRAAHEHAIGGALGLHRGRCVLEQHRELVAARRAARSSSLRDARSRSATVTSSASPAAWPSLSLTLLKSSRSRNMTAGALSSRRVRPRRAARTASGWRDR